MISIVLQVFENLQRKLFIAFHILSLSQSLELVFSIWEPIMQKFDEFKIQFLPEKNIATTHFKDFLFKEFQAH